MRVFVIDDNEAELDGIASTLSEQGFDVDGHIGLFGSAVALTAFQPDVVLVEQHVPDDPSEKLVSLMSRAKPDTMRVILLSDATEKELAAAARRCGADGYVRKNVPPDLLAETLVRAAGAN